MVRHEWLRCRAARDCLHHWRLDFHVVAAVKERANLMNHLAAQQKRALHFVVGHQVQITLAKARLSIGQPVPFLGWRAQRFGENHKRTQLHADLAGFGREHRALRTDEIPKIKMPENVELLIPEHVLLRVHLDAPGLVLDIDKHALAHVAMGRHTPRQRDFAGLGIIRARFRAPFRGRKLVPERIDPAVAQRLQFGLALLDQTVGLFHKDSKNRTPRQPFQARRPLPYGLRTYASSTATADA